MATGMPPHVHGIHGFTEPDPESQTGTRLVRSTSRKCKAYWNILTQEKIKNHVVGWFAGHPAEPIHGVCVSELFAKANRRIEEGRVAVQHRGHADHELFGLRIERGRDD